MGVRYYLPDKVHAEGRLLLDLSPAYSLARDYAVHTGAPATDNHKLLKRGPATI